MDSFLGRCKALYIEVVWLIVLFNVQIINAQTVTIDPASGFYNDSLKITIQTFPDTLKAYYTLDGSVPDTTDPVWQDSLVIYETKVLRVATFSPDFLDTNLVYRTYFLDEGTELPVFSITTDPDNLFSNERGIYVEGTTVFRDIAEVLQRTGIRIGNVRQDWSFSRKTEKKASL